MRVLAALSGGVDSAVAAARARDAGHEVTAVHLALSRTPQSTRNGARGCCSLEDARDASRVADVLELPYWVWDVSTEFQESVIDDFVDEYAAGRTPNPCVRCNESIKFSAVLARARALGYDAVCTGHYARLVDGPDGRTLYRARDAAKDQSYVLAVLRPDQLAGSMFPLGGDHKGDVRREAASRGLLVADKPDSHDICFIPDGDTAGFLTRRLGSYEGAIVDVDSGVRLGTHAGTHAFTIGQRRGLGLTIPAPDGAPRYVVGIDAPSRTVLVGLPQRLDVDIVHSDRASWCGTPARVGDRVEVQVRAHGIPVTATITALAEGSVVVHSDQPIRAAAPGQTLALYDGDRVLGAATITSASRSRNETPSLHPVEI